MANVIFAGTDETIDTQNGAEADRWVEYERKYVVKR